MSTEETRTVIENYWDAFSAKDVPKASSYFAQDITYEDLGIQQTHRGVNDVRAFWDLYFAAAGDSFKAVRDGLIVEGENYSFDWSVSGVINGSFGIFSGDGQAFTIRGISTGTVKDGLVVRNLDCWNLADVLRQIGAKEIPPIAP